MPTQLTCYLPPYYELQDTLLLLPHLYEIMKYEICVQLRCLYSSDCVLWVIRTHRRLQNIFLSMIQGVF